MSITYEEALATLEAMFGEPWTRETLDAVLRHEKGHMENTCDRILNHGAKDPQILLDRLKTGGSEPQVAIDEELARQLESGGSAAAAAPGPAQEGRGTPTELPADFLRIPGYKSTAAAAMASSSGGMDDATLARMLQDELFAEELRQNPDFAHLARGNRTAGGPASRSGARAPPGQRRAVGLPAAQSQPGNPFEGVNVMEKLSGLGDGARRRLQMFAANFENKLNGMKDAGSGGGQAQRGTLQEDRGAAAERRGLLDDNEEEEIEFEMRKKSN